MRHVLFFLLAFAVHVLTIGQVFDHSSLFSKAKEPTKVATHFAEDTQGLFLHEDAFQSVHDHRPGELTIEFDLPGVGLTQVVMQQFCNLSDDFIIARTSAEGTREEHYVPTLVTYEVLSATTPRGTMEDVSGTFVFYRHHVQGTMYVAGSQWEVRPSVDDAHLQAHVPNDYLVFDINKSIAENSFTCAVEDREQSLERQQQPTSQRSVVPQCVEIGLDIDNYTLNTFADCYGAIDWALGVLAGVDQIYRNELNDLITLQASYVNVWEIPEPWANTANDAGTMLDQLRVEWSSSNPVLSSANWDLVHLMTKRPDSGTGGIAYLSVVCDSNYGFGFSAGMTNDSNFDPLPSYAWNLDVVSHELGHNFGANHTHWCGWPGGPDHPSGSAGGPIDNCYAAEGGCADGPSTSAGTIMSYCHLNVGKVLQFHPVVEQSALFPIIQSQGFCHGNCAAIETSCGSFGCTDPTACNYNPDAVQDDGSCGVIDICGECAGGGASCTGCTDSAACNFFPDALYDDGSCSYPPPGYPCDCATDLAQNVTLGASQASATSTPGVGTLSTADVTLVWTNTAGDGSWAGDLLIEIGAPDGSCIGVGGYDVGTGCSLGSLAWPSAWNVSASGTYTHTIDLAPFNMTGDGDWSLNLINGWASSGGVNYDITVTLSGVCSGEPSFGGCTDPEACNYDPSATLDNGSCDLGTAAYFDSDNDGYGQFFAQYFCGNIAPAGTVTLDGDCNDANSTMYPGAPGTGLGNDNNCNGVIDPEEEEPPTCPEDVNQDGAVSVADVLAVLSEFGCTGYMCEYDIDGDSAVTVSDVLVVLSAFGASCS